MKKKILLSLMLICIGIFVFGMLNTSATTTGTYGKLSYEIYGNKVIITDCTDTATGELVIPAKINNYPVTEIGVRAFISCSKLTSITIPDSVTSIGGGAFAHCSSLISINIPKNVTNIDNQAFANCTALTDITIPNSITSINYGVFEGCSSLTSITIPESITSIVWNAFAGCTALTDITIPNSVTSIGSGAFSGCDKLTNINVDASNPNYCSENGIVYNKSKTEIAVFPGGRSFSDFAFPDNVVSIGNGAFKGYKGLTKRVLPT